MNTEQQCIDGESYFNRHLQHGVINDGAFAGKTGKGYLYPSSGFNYYVHL